MATVKLTREVVDQYSQLSKTVRERIRKVVVRLEQWPEVSDVKALSGGLVGWHRWHRLRTGDYRVRFYIKGDVVVIDKVGHRRDFMRTKSEPAKGVIRRTTMNGKRVVVLEETEFERLLRRADEWEPELPGTDDDGLYPAAEAMAVIQARDIIRARRKLGLSQAELARRAGIRVETLNRIENGKNKPNVRTIEKIDRALQRSSSKDRK